ncbi:oocyte zinc finger protein XlCOF6-like [Liolophura sinensis]|uniref:oocyte zinc finger protein XlCOF6-like n=1 Tax=Liolophura sinensis TaxID=3198878 RepID=UPI0031595E58
MDTGVEHSHEPKVQPVKTENSVLIHIPHMQDDSTTENNDIQLVFGTGLPDGAQSKLVLGIQEKPVVSASKESVDYSDKSVKNEAGEPRSYPPHLTSEQTRSSLLNQLLRTKPVQVKTSYVVETDLYSVPVAATRSEKRSRKTRRPTKRAAPVVNNRSELNRADIGPSDQVSPEPGDDSIPRFSSSLGLPEEQVNMDEDRECTSRRDTVKSRLLAPAMNRDVKDRPRTDVDYTGSESSSVAGSSICVSAATEQDAVDFCVKGSNSAESSNCVEQADMVSPIEDEFTCDICQKTFSSLGCLNSHTVTHIGKGGSTFGICRKDLPQQSRRKSRSLALIVDSPSNSSNTDQESFTEQFQLKSQGPTRIQTDQKSCICSVCGKCFRLPSLLKKHKRTHTGEKPHSCTTCGKAFSQRAHLKIHARSHTGEKPYACNLCDKTFTLQCSLKRHILTHTGIKAFTCNICQKSYYCRPDLNKHLRTHKGVKIFPRERPDIYEKPFVCSTCGKCFPRQSELKRHNMTHTGEKPHTCEVCGKCFSVQYKLKIHNLIHTGERPHVCAVCGKAFTQLSGLSLHRITHTGERPYTCDTCGKSFTHPSALSTHKRIHTGEKPYTCTTCGKSFGKSCSLRIHTLIHTGEKPFVCDVCGKSFIQSFALKTHKVTHTGKMPYNCSICGKGFTGHSAWKRHGLTHTGEKPFTCDICGQNFTRQFSLKTHYKKCQMSKVNILASSSSETNIV